jgi:hypothetical protein
MFVELGFASQRALLNVDKILCIYPMEQGSKVVMMDGTPLFFEQTFDEIRLEVELALIGDVNDEKL